MSRRGFLAGRLLACSLSVCVSAAQASASVPVSTTSLVALAARSATLEVGYRGGRYSGRYGGYHGYSGRYGGFSRGFYGSRYYGPRSYGWGWFPRPAFYLGLNYYRPFRGLYYSPYYLPPAYLSVVPSYYSVPVAGVVVGAAQAVTVPEALAVEGPAPESIPAPVPSVGATFPYDGGPQRLVPMPVAPPVAVPAPRKIVPAAPSEPPPDNSAVSLTVKPTRFAYPAYGEDRAPTSFAADRAAPAPQLLARKTGNK